MIALVRYGSAPGKVEALRTLGATIAEVDFSRPRRGDRRLLGCVLRRLRIVRPAGGDC